MNKSGSSEDLNPAAPAGYATDGAAPRQPDQVQSTTTGYQNAAYARAPGYPPNKVAAVGVFSSLYALLMVLVSFNLARAHCAWLQYGSTSTRG
jgi:hypothetical protein